VWLNWSGASPGSGPPETHPASPDPAGPPDAALLAGIAAYRRHPYRRDVTDPPAIWSEGGSRLLDYGPAGTPPVLFVPSLVNRAYVLDLTRGHSMLRFLSAGGVRPLLLDWGWPDPAAASFTLTDYIAGRLERAIAAVGAPVTLAGYCMGGLMAAAAAARRPDLIRRLALLATPWDFWSEGGDDARRLGASLPLLAPALSLGTLPVDALQVLFSLLEPGSVAAKYRGFASQIQDSKRASMFVAVEDWLNDGIPLAAPVAREVIGGWYGANAPALGHWRIAGAPVLPPALPAFVAIPARDRIVPPGSALALAQAIPGAIVVRPQAGHVGMVAGSGATAALWEPLLSWLLE
jgi:poly(3-hydroxyalkanoate) synthetase